MSLKTRQNVKSVEHHIREYQQIIDDLRLEIFELKEQLSQKATELPEGHSLHRYNSLREQKLFRVFALGQLPSSLFQDLSRKFKECFQEKMQLRRSLIELEDTNILNAQEIERKQEALNKLEQEGKNSNSPEYKNISTAIRVIKKNMNDNLKTKEKILKDTKDINEAIQSIRDQIPDKVTRQERKELFDSLIEKHNLELQNMELEMQLQIRDKIINDQHRILRG